MNYSGQRRKILLLFASLVAALALWLLFKKDEPKYQGKTAREWFNAAGKKQVSESEYQRALEALSTNFLPEFIAFGQGNHRVTWYLKWLPLLPDSLLQSMTMPESFYQHGKLAAEGMAFIGRSAAAREHVTLLREELRNTAIANQERMLRLVYYFLAGNPALHLSELPALRQNLEFPARFYEAFTVCQIRQINGGQLDRLQLAPVLVEAITNSALMTDIFGANSKKWQKIAYENLKALSPESATNYQNYIKQ